MPVKRSRKSHPSRQKLKREDIIDQYISAGIHILAFTLNGGALLWDVVNLSDHQGRNALEYQGFGGKFKYLTFWDQIIQTVYYGLAVANNVYGSNVGPSGLQSKRSWLQKCRDVIHATIVWPMGTFVVITFWGIYAVDRELVFPKSLDEIIPSWLNHIMHTTVILFLLMEKLFVYHWHPIRSKGLLGCLGFAAIYQIWILFIAWYADIWVYPILQVLAMPYRITFFVVLWVVLVILYILGESLTNYIWGPLKMVKKVQ